MKHSSVAFAMLILIGVPLSAAAVPLDNSSDLSLKVAALVRANESGLVAPRAPDAARAALARDVMDAGRVRELLASAETDTAFDDLGAGAGQISPQLRNAIKVVAKASYTPDQIIAFVEPRLAETLDEASLSAGLQWERSELGRRLTALQLRASSDEQRAEFRLFLKLRSKTPDERTRACGQVDVLSDSSNTLTPIFEAVATGGAVAYITEQSLALDVDAIGRGLAQMRPMIRDAARQTALAICLFYYRDLSDAELEQWLAFLRSDNGGRYARGASAAMRDAYLQRTEVFTRTLIEVARDLKKPATV